jgi:hypothetical protein
VRQDKVGRFLGRFLKRQNTKLSLLYLKQHPSHPFMPEVYGLIIT